MPKHKQVKVTYKKLSANIDVKIAPLILEIWKAGVTTDGSCQAVGDMDGMVWIAFQFVEDATRFLQIAGAEFNPAPDSLYNRMFPYWAPEAWGASEGREWYYEANVNEAGVDRGKSPDKDKKVYEPMVFFSIAVYFPQSDLPALLALLRQHNTANRRRGGKIHHPSV